VHSLRERINRFLEETGVKKQFICSQTGLKETTLCEFTNGNRSISYDKGLALDKFLESKSY